MSTYSWSYKTASRRQLPVRKTSAPSEEEGTGDHGEPASQRKQTVGVFSLRNSQTGTAKRLNWRAKIYVGNLNKKTNEASLAYYFSVFGDIDDVKLIRDHDTKESRGFAFVTFEKTESAEKAKQWCAYNYPTLDEARITVASAERRVAKTKAAPVNEYAPPRDPSQTLYWEYKWSHEPGVEVYGPYETNLMLAWKNQGYFDGGCWVRQMIHKVRDVEENKEILQGKEEELCEPTGSKKLKLAIDYSDSDEEDSSEDNEQRSGCGGVGSKLKEERSCVANRGPEEKEQVESEEGGEEQNRQRKRSVNRELERSSESDEGKGSEEKEGGKPVREGEEASELVASERECAIKSEEGEGRVGSSHPPGIKDIQVKNEATVTRNSEQKHGEPEVPCEDILTEYSKSELDLRTVVDEHENEDDDMENMSSDSEDVKDDLCTEFVPISEIDFNFFP